MGQRCGSTIDDLQLPDTRPCAVYTADDCEGDADIWLEAGSYYDQLDAGWFGSSCVLHLAYDE